MEKALPMEISLSMGKALPMEISLSMEKALPMEISLSMGQLYRLSPGILPGLVVIIGLEAALPVVSHGIALLWGIFPFRPFEYGTETRGLGGLGILLPGTASFPFWLLYAGYHLNRVHFEIGLKSVCCENPSLEAYFNSAVTNFLIYYFGRNPGKNYPFLK